MGSGYSRPRARRCLGNVYTMFFVKHHLPRCGCRKDLFMEVGSEPGVWPQKLSFSCRILPYREKGPLALGFEG